MKTVLRIFVLLGGLAWLQAFGAIGVPVDEPPAFCDKDRLPVKEAFSWATLWPELGLDRTVSETGRLTDAQVPPITRTLIQKYSALHSDQLQRPEVVTFLRTLKSVSEGAIRLADVDWKTDASTESGDTFILLASEKIRVACKPGVDPEEHLADMARLMPVLMKLANIQSTEALEWLNFAVAERERQAGNLLRNGLSMTPWEMKLNERFISDDDARRGLRQQWILLRPSAGTEINTRSREKGELEGSLAIEPLGFIRYLDASNYDEWLGISALLTSSTSGGIGYGFLLRYGNYTAGISWHKGSTNNGDDAYLFLGVDFYNFLDAKRPELQQFVEKYKTRVYEKLRDIK